MSSKNYTSLKGPLIVGAVLIGALAATPPDAHADVNDAAFIATIESRGITYATIPDAIAGAKSICAMLQDYSPHVVVLALTDDDLPFEDAAYLVGAASGAYCPELTPGIVA